MTSPRDSLPPDDATCGSDGSRPPRFSPDDPTQDANSIERPPYNGQRPTFAFGEVLAERYRVERFLARGGMGEVYSAYDLELDVSVALKTIRPEIASSPAALRRFKQEILLARSVTHPNVCRIYDHGRSRQRDQAVSFLTMEFLPGETLAARIASRGKLSTGETLPILKQLAEGLDAAHRAGIVHRDLKSANVMLVPTDSGERAVITDFGLAMGTPEVDGGEEGSSPGLVGTPAYMAPEQVRGEPAGPAADLYALGVVLYEMATGELPFRGQTALETARARLTDPPPAPSTRVECPTEWEDAILRLLSLEPEARFASAAAVVHAVDPRRSDTLPARERARHSLPAERDAFVGRRDVLAAMAERLERGATLLTLLGPGGTGKTRLARHYGWASLDRWPGGVWFCDLTEARDLDGIAYAVATALDVPLGKGDVIAQLGHAIAGRGRSLVIIDNLEQVAEHAEASLGRWLVRAQETSFLLTTRERLRLGNETVLELEPLDPATDGVDLFEHRAKAERPGFAITSGNEATVVEIVRTLEGLPLAIELAASRLQALSLEQLRDRLRDRFSVLSGPKRGRQGTLRATLDWSWELLTVWEQAAVAQASVFEGGFTLEAAEAVMDLRPWSAAPSVLDVIRSLIDKSWLRARAALDAPRFSMYATVQEYAAEKLRGAPPDPTGNREPMATEMRHGNWFAALGTDDPILAPDPPGGTRSRRDGLHREFENLLVACKRAVERADGRVAALSYACLWGVLSLRGPATLAAELGARLLRIPGLPAAEGANSRRSFGAALQLLGQSSEAREQYETALAIHRDTGNRHGEGVVLGHLGSLHRQQSRMAEARECYEAAIAMDREVGDRRSLGIVLGNLGNLHSEQGRMQEARECYEGALSIHREIGNRRSEGHVLGSLGVLHHEQGRMSESRAHYEAALAIHREVGDRRFEGAAIGNLGGLLYEEGRVSEARDCYEAALSIHREVGDRVSEGIVLGNLGILDSEQGRMSETVLRYEAALAIHREVGNRRNEGTVLGKLGLVRLEQGRIAEAREHLYSALAIHRAVGDRGGEGVSLRALGLLEFRSGSFPEARALLAESEALLRATDQPLELGKLFCVRAECEALAGDPAVARAAFDSATALAAELGAGPESELGSKLARIRMTLA